VVAVPTVKEILLIGFYDDGVFKDFITETHKQYPDISIKYLREYKAMGTAGGLYHFRDVILKGNPSKFFVIHADICCSFPLKEINDLYEEKSAKAVILGTKVSKEVAGNFGAIVSDSDQKVIHYVEKPESQISNLINAGVYLFDKSLFDVIADARDARESSLKAAFHYDDDSEEVLSLETDILVRLPETGAFYVYETKDFWRQIKTAGSAVPANALYLQQAFQANPNAPGLAQPSATIVPPVYIDPTAHVDPTAKLGPNVSIGPGAKIGQGSRIKDSIILDDVEIKQNAIVLHSIVSKGSKVGNWARVEGSPTAVDDHNSTVIKDGAKVHTVSILASNVVIADEIHVQNTVVLPHKEIKSDVKNEVIM
jgi:mannose-1-phosphate guanylyltransferase